MASTDLRMRMPMSSVMRDLTMNVTVTGVRAHAVRQWFALHLIRLAARVLGCGIHVDIEKGHGARR